MLVVGFVDNVCECRVHHDAEAGVAHVIMTMVPNAISR